MMMRTSVMIGLTILAIGCTSPKEDSSSQEVEAEPEMATQEDCVFGYNPSSTEVLWVAYKYTDKTGVKGVFDSVWVENTSASDDPLKVLEGATVRITTASINSGDPTRDPKIVESFFGSLQGGEELTGKVLKIQGDNSAGNMTLELAMNGFIAPVEGGYSIQENRFEFKAEISTETWAAGEALGELNRVCSDLHKSADGQSVLWPDVTIFISTTLSRECDEVASLN
jgi:hypothetical protein